MEIELKNIYVNHKMSRETTLFEADIYINGVKAGYAENDGRGGSTDIRASDAEGRKLIEQAEAYCKTLPDKIHEWEVDGKPDTYREKMSLEVFVDQLLDEYVKKKDLAQFEKKMQKAMENSILFGVPGSLKYGQQKYRYPIEQLLSTPGFRAGFKTSLANIVSEMKEDEKILNTNIHPEELVKLGVPPDRIIPVKAEVKRKPTSPRVPGGEKKKGGKRP